MKFSKIPTATITRLSIYSRYLEALSQEGVKIIASDKLAQKCGINPAQIRKDLAYFGEFGIRGVGYFVKELLFEIKRILGLNKTWKMALVGIGNLGSALLAHQNFIRQGYEFVAVFDIDPAKVGRRVPSGQIIHSVDELESVVKDKGVEIGVIATPAAKAQRPTISPCRKGSSRPFKSIKLDLGIFRFYPEAKIPEPRILFSEFESYPSAGLNPNQRTSRSFRGFILVPKLQLGNANLPPSFVWGPLVFTYNLLKLHEYS